MSDPDLQPTLADERVLLRPVRSSDWEPMFAAASDPLIWAGHPVRERYTEPLFRDFFEGALASRSALAILDRGTDEIIGCSRYHDYRPSDRRIEIGYTFLARSRWGGAYNHRVKTLMLDHAFRYVDWVQFGIAETNLRSRAAIEKIGATLAGTEFRHTNGEAIRYLIYQIGRSA